MTHRRACLLVAVLGCAAALPVMLRASDNRPNAGVEVMVKGVSQPKFVHNGRLYVEALKGREYAIRLRNPYPVRVAVALSVDGLNTIDARETTAGDARKWVLGPYEIVTISGWQTSQSEARRFEFTTEARSYGAALGKTENLGMITAVFFKERVPVPVPYSSNDERRRQDQGPASPVAAAQEAGAAPSRLKSGGRIRRDRHGTPNGSRCDAGMARPRGHAVADREHPLRVPSTAREARHPVADSRPTRSPRTGARVRGQLQPGASASAIDTTMISSWQAARSPPARLAGWHQGDRPDAGCCRPQNRGRRRPKRAAAS